MGLNHSFFFVNILRTPNTLGVNVKGKVKWHILTHTIHNMEGYIELLNSSS